MSKINKSSYPKSTKDFKNDPIFYEELTILKAQEKIAELMKSNNISKTELAKSLNQSKAHITELLSDGRNLTLRTFSRICFHLNAEIDFQTYLIGAKHSVKKLTSDNKFVSYSYQLDKDLLLSITDKVNNTKQIQKNIDIFIDVYNKIKEDTPYYNKDRKQFVRQGGNNSKVA